MNYTKEKKVLIQTILMCGRELLKYYKKVDTLKVDRKSRHETVTPADFASNKIAIANLSKHFKSHGFLSEETGQDRLNTEYLWVIDPLDGTTNFSIGNHFFNVSIALVHNNEVVLGAIYAPFFEQLFVAEKDKGAYLYQVKNFKIRPTNKKIKVSKEDRISHAMVDFGYSYNNQKNEKFIKVYKSLLTKFEHSHNLGAAALELAWVAMGRLEAYALTDVKPWDVSAGILLVKEAGGNVSDMKNNDFNFSNKALKDMVASNGLIHQELIKLIAL